MCPTWGGCGEGTDFPALARPTWGLLVLGLWNPVWDFFDS